MTHDNRQSNSSWLADPYNWDIIIQSDGNGGFESVSSEYDFSDDRVVNEEVLRGPVFVYTQFELIGDSIEECISQACRELQAELDEFSTLPEDGLIVLHDTHPSGVSYFARTQIQRYLDGLGHRWGFEVLNEDDMRIEAAHEMLGSMLEDDEAIVDFVVIKVTFF